MKIAVLAGGYSPERNVSLCSGTLISAALIRKGHKVAFADVYVGIKNMPSDVDTLFTDKEPPVPKITETEPDLDALKAENGGRNELIGEGILELCRAADVVFLALHGGMGENGQLQATLDNMAVTYTGSGYIGCLLSMDKDISKKILAGEGIAVPYGVTGLASELIAADVAKKTGFPCVVKPCSAGSSVGVSIVNKIEELDTALRAAGVHEDRVIVESFVAGREFSVGVLGGKALPAIEIIPKDGFYDYKNKYQSGMTTEICPAELSADEEKAAGELAVAVFNALRMDCYARVDMILDKTRNKFVCLEANALPGMTPMSLMPQEAAADGIDYDTLCDTLVSLAVKKRG